MPVDIADCAREPIHIPGAIQPHGCLLTLDPVSMHVLQSSANVQAFLGRPQPARRPVPASRLLPDEIERALRERLEAPASSTEPLRWGPPGESRIAMVHRQPDGLAIVEIEHDAEDDPGVLDRALARGIHRLSGAASLAALFDEATALVEELTGFERVMVYRFDEDGHGEVVAERAAPDLDPYLGLHYPESDIPRQARALYLRSWIRAIPDARYRPVPIAPLMRPDTQTPLDLGGCSLRSVSPVHLEYLANMGIQASMSVSLIVGGRLWGLISCGHRTAHPIPLRLRAACESIGRLLSSQIGAFEAIHRQAAEAANAPVIDRLVDGIEDEDDVLVALTRHPTALLGLVGARGAVAISGESLVAIGQGPPPADARRLADWVTSRVDRGGVFQSHAVAGESGTAVVEAAGVLAIGLPGPETRCLLWVRPEVVQTVNWGGDPNKAVQQRADDPTPRLHPRRSFELWKETVRGESLRWSDAERRAAAQLRRLALEIDLGKQVRRERDAVRARDDLVAVVSHDLRTPMSVVVLQAALIQRLLATESSEKSRRLRTSAQMIQRAGDRMSTLLHDLLDLAKIEAGRYQVSPVRLDARSIVDDACTLLEPVALSRRIELACAPIPEVAVRADPERVFQVLANLVGNALKFSPEGTRVTLEAGVVGDQCEFRVRDQGAGIPASQLPHLFDRYWQAKRTDADGAGLGLYIALGIVKAHGGEMRVHSVEGQGAEFAFTLPLA